jgi:hypothetical protein
MNMPKRLLSVVLIIIPLLFATSFLLVSQQGSTPEQPIPLPQTLKPPLNRLISQLIPPSTNPRVTASLILSVGIRC